MSELSTLTKKPALVFYEDRAKVTTLIPMNLQLFAGDSGGEKTEQATPRRKEKAREEGQVAKSIELTTTFMLIVMFASIRIFGGGILKRIIGIFEVCIQMFNSPDMDLKLSTELFRYLAKEAVFIIGPLFAIAFFVAFISNVLQVGWKITVKPMQPKLSNLSPINGLKRMFSLKTLVELIKSILKITIILVIVYFSVRDYQNLMLTFYDLPVLEAYGIIMELALDVGIKIGAFFLVVAIIDYIYQRFSLAKKLRMSKQEIKDEYKMTEGNPEIKSRIRQRMREASMRRMMQDLPKADVVITNPTHFAVAISYDDKVATAPVVLAKGADLVATRIRAKATELGIEIVENKPLARALFYTVEIGEEIPPELYQSVAEILAFVYNLKNQKKEGARA